MGSASRARRGRRTNDELQTSARTVPALFIESGVKVGNVQGNFTLGSLPEVSRRASREHWGGLPGRPGSLHRSGLGPVPIAKSTGPHAASTPPDPHASWISTTRSVPLNGLDCRKWSDNVQETGRERAEAKSGISRAAPNVPGSRCSPGPWSKRTSSRDGSGSFSASCRAASGLWSGSPKPSYYIHLQ